MNKALLISETTLKKYTLINDNVDGKYISTAIQAAQDIDLTDLIGPALVAKLEQLVFDGTIKDDTNANYKTLLDTYITPYMSWQVMSAIQVALNYKMTNSGVIQNDDTNRSHLDYRSNQALMDQYERYSNSYATKLKAYLDHNSNLFPEYNKCINGITNEDNPTYGIYLGDVFTCKKNYVGK